jgi:hypothetical protein
MSVDLVSLFGDKRVVLVGPAPYLMGRGKGELIDSYDVVCRINTAGPIDSVEDYGYRTDVIFHNCNCFLMGQFRKSLLRDTKRTSNVKCVIHPQDEFGSDGQNSIKCFNDLNKEFNLPFYHVPKEFVDKFQFEGMTGPLNTGYISLLFLLYQNMKELFLTGFTFFQQGDKYKDIYYKEYYTNDGFFQGAPESFKGIGHNQTPQINYLKEVLLKDFEDKFVIDSYLSNLLSIEHDKVVDMEKI